MLDLQVGRCRRTCLFSLLVLMLGAWAALAPNLANAQEPLSSPPPVFSSVDSNGVDLVTGAFNVSTVDLTIGQPNAGGLAFGRTFIGSGWRHNYVGTLTDVNGEAVVSLGGSSESFSIGSGGTTFTSLQGSGSTLTYNSGTAKYTYASSTGMVAIFDGLLFEYDGGTDATMGRIISITSPNGEVTTFHYRTIQFAESGTILRALRLQSVTNNFGYQLHFDYAIETTTQGSALADWRRITSVTAINNAIDYCDPTADNCTGLSSTWPSVSYARSGLTETVTDAAGRTARFTYGFNTITAIRRPTSTTSDHTTITYSAGRVATVSNGSATWTYGYSDNAGVRTTTVTDPLSNARVVTSDLATSRVLTDADALSRTMSYQYDSEDRLTRITMPEGNYAEFVYDARGNITQTTQVAKSGSGLANIVTSASYPSTCSNQVTCNLPTSVTDARGNVTDFTYDSTHGGILTATLPDPDGAGSAVRPQTRYAYEQTAARYYVSPTNTDPGPPIWRPTQVSGCATSTWTGSACASGTADETRTTIGYGSTSVPNNRLPLTISTGAGDGSLTATETRTYDNVSNIATVDGPLSGTADTTTLVYDAVRQLEGVIGPDPDDGGSLLRRATRFTYNGDGQVTLTRQGTVTGTSAWTGWTSLQQVVTQYDFIGRPTQRSFSDGITTFSVMQTSYDAANRLDCTAVRMNPSIFGSLPSSACTLGTQGAHGPDRIARITYNNADQPTKLTIGYGTAAATDEWERTYTNNGLVDTLEDASNNVTDYAYDGFDRLSRITFPSSTYEEFTYDATSNVTLQRRRDATTLTNAYDAMNRITSITPSTNGAAISYAYDNFSRFTSTTSSSRTLTYTYDQLSRLLSEAQSPLGTVNYQWDLAGRRTRITWPDGVCAQYAYNLANAVTQISAEGGSCTTTTLATYAYDNLGRRTGVTRNNGTSEAAAFDGASRLTALTQNLSGTSQDVTFEYEYDAAGGIVDRDVSNSAYVFSPLSPSTINYADNSLNQYTSVGGVTQSYDNRGNLTAGSLSYDIFNRLVSGPSSATLAYDPQGRLYETAGGLTTRFLYDGAQIIGEYNGSNVLQRRFIPGPALDEPLAWYEGSGTSDRRWFAADERGSVIAVLNNTGAASTINTYDEYGLRGSSNAGRFQFTGAPWLPDVSLYHLRARAYSPTLGRFMQPDPILQAGGMNLYAYVGNDPINGLDPSGLQTAGNESVTVTGCPTNRICDPDLIRELITLLLRAVDQSDIGEISLEQLSEAITQEAICQALEIYFSALFGPAGKDIEALWRFAPGDYTFARLTIQGAYLGGGGGASVSRYTHQSSGDRTYVVSTSVSFGVPFHGNPTTVRTPSQAAWRLATGGIGATYGTSSGPDAAPLGGEGELTSIFSASFGGGRGGSEFGIGAGWGGAFNISGETSKVAQISCAQPE
jgi:RHS repeat-associated protein